MRDFFDSLEKEYDAGLAEIKGDNIEDFSGVDNLAQESD